MRVSPEVIDHMSCALLLVKQTLADYFSNVTAQKMTVEHECRGGETRPLCGWGQAQEQKNSLQICDICLRGSEG